MSDKRRILVNTLAKGGAQFAALIAAVVSMPFLVRAFGLQDYGLYLLVLSMSGYATLLDLGVGASLVKMVAEKSVVGDRGGIGALASSALAFYAAVGVVSAAAFILMGLSAGSLFRVDAEGARLLRNLLYAAAAGQLLRWPAATAVYVLGGYQRYTATARVELGVTLGFVASIVLVLTTHRGPLALMIAGESMVVLGAMAKVVLAREQLRGVRVSPFRAEGQVLRSIFMFSWAIFAIDISSVILYQQTDRLVLGIFVGTAAVTLYEAAGKFQALASQLTIFATSTVLPMASHLDAQGRKDSLQTLFLRGSKYTAALIAPIVVTVAVLAKPLILAWLGPLFVEQALAAQILVLPQILVALGPVGDRILTGQGKLPKRLPYVMSMAVGNLGLSLLLVGRLGILGVVLGTSIPYLVDFPFHIRLLLRQTGVGFDRWFRGVILPVYPLLLLPMAISMLAVRTMLTSGLLGPALAGMLSVGSYWLAFLFFGLTPKERSEVRAVWLALRKRLSPSAE